MIVEEGWGNENTWGDYISGGGTFLLHDEHDVDGPGQSVVPFLNKTQH